MYFKGNDDVVELGTIVVNGPQFMSILNDFEKSTEIIEITVDPDKQNINITTLGLLVCGTVLTVKQIYFIKNDSLTWTLLFFQDTSDVNIPKTCDMIHVFSCTNLIKLRYKFPHIRLMMKALALATKVIK